MSFISRVQLNLLEIFEIGRFFVTVGTEVTRVTASASELNLNAAHTESFIGRKQPSEDNVATEITMHEPGQVAN